MKRVIIFCFCTFLLGLTSIYAQLYVEAIAFSSINPPYLDNVRLAVKGNVPSSSHIVDKIEYTFLENDKAEVKVYIIDQGGIGTPAFEPFLEMVEDVSPKCDVIYTINVEAYVSGDLVEEQELLVSMPYIPILEIKGDTSSICEGESVELFVKEEGFSTYEWSNGSSELINTVDEEGYQYLTVTNGIGCAVTDSFWVDIHQVTPDLGNDTTLVEGKSIVLNGSTEDGTTYLWNTGEKSPEITVNEAGTYSLEVMSDIGCLGSDEIIISFYTDIHEQENYEQITAAYDPSTRNVHVQSKTNIISSIYLVNIKGQLVYQEFINTKEITLKIPNLSSGIYFLQCNFKGYQQNLIKIHIP